MLRVLAQKPPSDWLKLFDSQSEASIKWFLKLTLATKQIKITFDQSNVKGYGKLCQKLVSFLCTILFEVTWAFGIFTWTMFKTTDANFDAVF